MPIFTPSTIAFATAVEQIADAAGASADVEMRGRAFRSLQASLKYFNGRHKWVWLQQEANPIIVVAPFGVTITADASGVASASAASGHGLLVDDFIVGSGFVAGARVTAVSGAAGATAQIGFNANITGITAAFSGSVTAARDFYDWPSDFKQAYSFRSLGTLKPLWPAQRRLYDRGVTNEFTTGTPEWYDIFSHFQRGKVRLLPPPNAADVLQLRYYRRMSVPTASGTSSVLDIPDDYDFALIAWAKWHFLTDKKEARAEQATTWLNLANEGIRTMMADQTNLPDETLGFVKGPVGGWPPRGSTRGIAWEYS